MGTLNDIPEYLQEGQDAAWTPGRGMLRGLLRTAAVAAILAGVLCVATAISPAISTIPWHEPVKLAVIMGAWHAILGFGVAAVLFACMQRWSGNVGTACNIAVVVLSIAIFATKHLVLALVEFDWGPSAIQSWAWLHPQHIFTTNAGAWLGVAMAVGLLKNGDSLRDYL